MDQSEYLVVVNEEDQHALWPAHQGVPAGWQQRYSGSRDACLSYVEDAWPDILPRSLREDLERERARRE